MPPLIVVIRRYRTYCAPLSSFTNYECTWHPEHSCECPCSPSWQRNGKMEAVPVPHPIHAWEEYSWCLFSPLGVHGVQRVLPVRSAEAWRPSCCSNHNCLQATCVRHSVSLSSVDGKLLTDQSRLATSRDHDAHRAVVGFQETVHQTACLAPPSTELRVNCAAFVCHHMSSVCTRLNIDSTPVNLLRGGPGR